MRGAVLSIDSVTLVKALSCAELSYLELPQLSSLSFVVTIYDETPSGSFLGGAVSGYPGSMQVRQWDLRIFEMMRPCLISWCAMNAAISRFPQSFAFCCALAFFLSGLSALTKSSTVSSTQMHPASLRSQRTASFDPRYGPHFHESSCQAFLSPQIWSKT